MAFNWRLSTWKCSRGHLNTFRDNPFRCGVPDCREPIEDRGGPFYHVRQYFKIRRERAYARQAQEAQARLAPVASQRRTRRTRGRRDIRQAVWGPPYGQPPPGGYVNPSPPFQRGSYEQRERELALKREEVGLRRGERERGLRQEEVYRMTGPFKTIRYYIGRAFPYTLLLLIIGLAYLYIFASQRAEFREAIGQRFEIIAERLNLANVFKETFKYLSPGYIEQVVTDVGSFERNPTYAVQEAKGVTVEYFRPIRPELFERQPIWLDAKVLIEALPEDDAKVTFGCFLEEDNETITSPLSGTIEITRQPPGENLVTVKKGKDRIVNVKCIFKEGIPSVGSNDFKDYVAYLTWTYEGFVTKTILNPYLLRSELLEDFEAQNRDPLETQKKIETDVSKEGFSIAHCISGCGLVDLRLSLQSTLPLTEIGTAFLLVDIKDKQLRKGDITKLHSIKLTLPQEHVQLGSEGCPEIDSRLTLQEPHPFLTAINTKLANNEKPVIQYYCELKATPVGAVTYPVSILAEATYDYGDKYISNRFKVRKPGSEIP